MHSLRTVLFLCLMLVAGSTDALICAEALISQPARGKLAQRRFAVTQAEPAVGTIHTLTVFARFADEGGSEQLPSWTQVIFDPRRPGSLTHYFQEMSHGQFSLEGTVLPQWYVAKGPAAAYLPQVGAVGIYGRFSVFVREVLDQVDRDLDLGAFDNDGPDGVANSGDDDGYVDYIFVNTQSVPEGFIVSTTTGIASLGLGTDYTTSDRSARGGFIKVRADANDDGPGGALQQTRNLFEAVGTMAHEFGHAFGLPDLFDHESQRENIDVDDSAGIGYWGVMGHGNRGWQDRGGPNPFCLWSLAELGWIGVGNADLVVVEGAMAAVEFVDLREGGKAYKLQSRIPGVYLLVGYRTPDHSYYERDLPGTGLIVWQIDERNVSNEDERSKRVDLVSADGLYGDRGFPVGQLSEPQLGLDNLDFWAHDDDYQRGHAGNLGDATDLFDGVRFRDFSVLSNPAAPPGVSMGNIRRRGGRIVADLNAADNRWAGAVLEDAVWQDTVMVVGDVLVGKKVTLSILPGTVVRFGPDNLQRGLDPAHSELTVEGKLLVNQRVAGFTERVVFTSAAAQPMPGDWYGIVASDQAEVILENVRIEYPRIGLQGIDIRRRVETAQLSVLAAAAYGIYIAPLRSELYLTRLEVRDSGRTGVYVAGPGTVHLGRALLVDNAHAGLEIHHGTLRCLDSEFVDNGHTIDAGANLVIAAGAGGQVLDSRFTGGVGIELRASAKVAIARNILANNRIGLVLRDASPDIARNAFIDNELVLRVEGDRGPALLELNASEGTGALLDNRAAIALVARNNWWGVDRAEEIAVRMRGIVDWQPFLTVDPRRPLAFVLQQSYPNPFNGSTLIRYSVGVEMVTQAEAVSLVVYAATGQLVRRLRGGRAVAGEFSAVWDGRDTRGQRVASGSYYYELRVGARRVVKKMLLLQ